MHSSTNISATSIIIKTTIVHTASYFIMGLLALVLFNYTEKFSSGVLGGYMRPVSDPIVMFGPAFQLIRGFLFGIVFVLLKDILFTRSRGWLTIWLMLAIIGILSTFGAAPGSIEGAIYTRLSYPTLYDIGMIEVYGQAMILAVGVFYWVRNPHNLWVGWGFSIVAALAVLLVLPALFFAPTAG